VICGMDPVCCESKSWMETANVEKLPKGPNQPFYQVIDTSRFIFLVSTAHRRSQYFLIEPASCTEMRVLSSS
jgi:hypothetical protein